MSRSGYVDDLEDMWAHIRWRGAVASAIRGKRGQSFIREAIEALDALPEKKLVQNELVENGCFCTLGAVGHKRGIDMESIDAYDYDTVAATFGVSGALAREIMSMNDDSYYHVTPEQRWFQMRNWLVNQLEN